MHKCACVQTVQGLGVGAARIDHLLEVLASGLACSLLEVRLSNFRAIRLYQERGFVKIGERRDYYKTALGREDALLMCREATD